VSLQADSRWEKPAPPAFRPIRPLFGRTWAQKALPTLLKLGRSVLPAAWVMILLLLSSSLRCLHLFVINRSLMLSPV
jgi:hypothetical protein